MQKWQKELQVWNCILQTEIFIGLDYVEYYIEILFPGKAFYQV